MRTNLLILPIFLSLLCAAPLYGQHARIYTTSSGLPSTQINCISQDGEGCIWVGSQAGLTRFDGVEFTSYECGNVVSLLCDSLSRLWVGTSTGMLLYERESGSFGTFDFRDPRNSRNTQFTSDIAQFTTPDGERVISVCTTTDGTYLYSLEADPDGAHPLRKDSLRTEKLSSYVGTRSPEKSFLDSHGTLWLLYQGGGLGAFRYSDLTPVDMPFSPTVSRDPSTIRFLDIMEDPVTGKILLGSVDMGILVFDYGEGAIRRTKEGSPSNLWVSSMLRAPRYDTPGKSMILVGKGEDGFCLWDSVGESFSPGGVPYFPHVLDRWKISQLMQDSQGNIWAAGYQFGLLVVPQSLYGFEVVTLSDEGYRDENTAPVSSIFVDPARGDLWVGTDGAGVFRRTPDGSLSHLSQRSYPSGHNAVQAIAMDSEGWLWVGTYYSGLHLGKPGTGQLGRFAHESLPDNIKTLLLDTKSSRLYVGTLGGGVVIVDTATKRVIGKVPDCAQWVSSLSMGDDGLLWIGSYNGLFCFNPANSITVSFNISDDPQAERIYALASSHDGTVWIGTGRGVGHLDPRTSRVEFFTQEDGLSDNMIKGMVMDGDVLWVSANRGVTRFDTVQGKFTRFYASDGLQGNEFHTGAAFKDSDGKIYLGGNDGLTVIDPSLLRGRQDRIPPVRIRTLTLLDTKMDILALDRVKVGQGNEYMTFSFGVMEYTNPEDVEYSYMLEGFDHSPRLASPLLREATYTNVPHGKYTFRVKAWYGGDEGNMTEASIPIEIAAPWFLRWWAFLLYLALGVALAALPLSYVREARGRKRAKALDEMKEVRLRMFTNFTHEVKTPLNLVMSPLKRLRENEENPRLKDTYNLMYRNCLRINRIVNQLLDLRKVDSGQMKLHFVPTDIIFFIKDIMQSFCTLAQERDIDFTLQTQYDRRILFIDQGNFDKIIFNILSNAFKYTPPGGKITVDVSSEGEEGEGRVFISIFNSGSSIDGRYLDRVFERYFQASPDDRMMGSGVGLHLTKMLVELHHGKIWALNRDGGVEFCVSLPEGNRHLTVEELSYTDHHKDLYIRASSSSDDIEGIPPVATVEPSPSKAVKNRKNLVIVEDDPEMLRYLGEELSRRYNVTSCPGGEVAWKEITRTLPDAVVTDIIMPGMDGMELCSKIRHNPSTNHIPVIFLTSKVDEDTQRLCNEAGADRFYSKPVSVDILESGIAQTIASRSALKSKYRDTVPNEYDKVDMPSDRNNLYRNVVKFIKEHLDDPGLSVGAISDRMGMSRVHLNRRLKEMGAPSPNALIKAIRLKQAAYLLVHKNVNVSEVAFQVGFTSHSYFTQAFRDYFGMSPKDFTAKYQGDPDGEALSRLLE